MYSPVIFALFLAFHGAVCDREEESDEEFALVRPDVMYGLDKNK